MLPNLKQSFFKLLYFLKTDILELELLGYLLPNHTFSVTELKKYHHVVLQKLSLFDKINQTSHVKWCTDVQKVSLNEVCKIMVLISKSWKKSYFNFYFLIIISLFFTYENALLGSHLVIWSKTGQKMLKM